MRKSSISTEAYNSRECQPCTSVSFSLKLQAPLTPLETAKTPRNHLTLPKRVLRVDKRDKSRSEALDGAESKTGFVWVDEKLHSGGGRDLRHALRTQSGKGDNAELRLLIIFEVPRIVVRGHLVLIRLKPSKANAPQLHGDWWLQKESNRTCVVWPAAIDDEKLVAGLFEIGGCWDRDW